MFGKQRVDGFVIGNIPVMVRIWNVDDLSPALGKTFELILPGFYGLEFTGEFSLDNYSLLKLEKI
jgi:hypothetical protein